MLRLDGGAGGVVIVPGGPSRESVVSLALSHIVPPSGARLGPAPSSRLSRLTRSQFIAVIRPPRLRLNARQTSALPTLTPQARGSGVRCPSHPASHGASSVSGSTMAIPRDSRSIFTIRSAKENTQGEWSPTHHDHHDGRNGLRGQGLAPRGMAPNHRSRATACRLDELDILETYPSLSPRAAMRAANTCRTQAVREERSGPGVARWPDGLARPARSALGARAQGSTSGARHAEASFLPNAMRASSARRKLVTASRIVCSSVGPSPRPA